jgi:peptidoglycan hydrolase-like protein with peptidoglycan-binding domain
MGRSPKTGPAKPFDLLSNPFFLLALEPTASLEKIADAYEDAVADQIASEPDLTTAREALVNPRQRLAAELSFLFDTPPGQVKAVCAALKVGAPSNDLLGAANRLAPLSKANLLTHVGAREQAEDDLLFALMDAHARIEPRIIHSKLQSTRQAAGFVVPSLDSVRDQLHELISLHVKAVLAGYPTARTSARSVGECIKRILISADSDRIDALEGLVRSYGQTISSELHKIEEEIRSDAEELRSRPREVSLVDPLADRLRDWISVANPIVEFDAHKGRDETRARQLFNEVRGLAIDLANQHNSFHVALSISNVAAEVFSSLPRATEQLKEDLPLLEERSAEALVIPLKTFVDELSKWTIVSDLLAGGFGPSSIGTVQDLWQRFSYAATQTQHTIAGDLPWILLRSLAVDINNDESSPLAAKAILEGLLKCAEEIQPSKEMLEKISEDMRACHRNIREKQVIEDIKANRISPALDGVYELLRNPTSQEDRQSLTKLKDQLEQKRRGRSFKWAAVAVVGAIIVIANISDNSSPRSSKTTSNYPSGGDYSGRSQPSPPAEPIIETKPPAGSGNVFTQANIRYCTFQKERFRTMQQDLRSNEEIRNFNTLVDDYNARCANFKYRERDLQAVTDELRNRSETLAAEARSILLGWRSRPESPSPSDNLSVKQPPAATQPYPSMFGTSNQSITSDKPSVRDEKSFEDLNADLLRLEAAIKVQKRLGELGYFRGPNNGAWGPQSRNSLRSFKVTNGLVDDDAFDAPTSLRLYSAAATRSPSSGVPTAQPVSQETSYPPPSGATMTPLNRSDATKIHTKLRELGFYRGNSLVLWSPTSRNALRDFKARNQLDANDVWDAATERRLMSATPSAGTDPLQDEFSAAIGGLWSIDIRACPGGIGGSDALVLTIGPKGAETDGARCDFANVSGAGTNWRTLGTCVVNGDTRRANINLTRTGDALVWSSEKGTTKYFRCPG